jgi:hypothetical protein
MSAVGLSGCQTAGHHFPSLSSKKPSSAVVNVNLRTATITPLLLPLSHLGVDTAQVLDQFSVPDLTFTGLGSLRSRLEPPSNRNRQQSFAWLMCLKRLIPLCQRLLILLSLNISKKACGRRDSSHDSFNLFDARSEELLAIILGIYSNCLEPQHATRAPVPAPRRFGARLA